MVFNPECGGNLLPTSRNIFRTGILVWHTFDDFDTEPQGGWPELPAGLLSGLVENCPHWILMFHLHVCR